MSILPILTARVVLQVLKKAGFVVARQVGSHIQLRHPVDPRILVTVPNHARDLTRGLLSSILKQAKLTPEMFLKLLKGK